MRRTIMAFAGVATLAGCASTSGSLERASASAIGQNILPDDVTVSNVDRNVMNVKWTADTPQGRYSCSADDMVRRPYCVRQ